MTEKERLIKFLKNKNKLILDATGIEYINKEDIEEIERDLTEASCSMILSLLKAYTDASCCPWCILHSSNCIPCGYANRHGKCNKTFQDNTYGEIHFSLGNHSIVRTFETALKALIKEIEK